MNDLIQVTGTQSFMGREIPVVLGGFGPDKKSICDKTIAEIHEMKPYQIRELLNRNICRFKFDVDIIDMKKGIVLNDTLNEMLQKLGYSRQSITQAEHIYVLSERGYMKLIKIMDSDTAWEIHDKLVDDYFRIRDDGANEAMSDLEMAVAATEKLAAIGRAMLEQRRKTQEQDKKISELENRVDNTQQTVKDAVAVFAKPSSEEQAWQENANRTINDIVKQNDLGYEEYRVELYDKFEQRAGAKLSVRQKNEQERLRSNGATATRIKSVSKLSVIAHEKRFRAIFDGILREEQARWICEGLPD